VTNPVDFAVVSNNRFEDGTIRVNLPDTNDGEGVGIDPVDYGADPTGVEDSQPAFQAAIEAGIALKIPVEPSAGTYKFTAFDTGIRHLQAIGPTNVSDGGFFELRGRGKVTLVSSAANCEFIHLRTALHRPVIEGIEFVNDSIGGTTNKIAIGTFGFSSNKIHHLDINRCTFKGFSRHISLNGVLNPKIHHNNFLAPNGRDGGTTTDTDPNVFVWGFINSNGSVINAEITHNYVNGYSGLNGIDVDAPTTRACMDGFTYGAYNGAIIANNQIVNCQFEPLFASTASNDPDTEPDYEVLVQDNTVEGLLPPNSWQLNTTDPIYQAGWGIRVDAKSATVEGNTVRNCRNGIYCETQAAVQRLKVQNNTIHQGFDYENNSGILVGAQSTYTTEDIIVSENFIVYEYAGAATANRGAIHVVRANNVLIHDNKIIFKNFITDATYKKQGIWLYGCDGVDIDGNYVSGCDHYLDISTTQTATNVSVRNVTDRTLSGFYDGAIPAGVSELSGEKTVEILTGSATLRPVDVAICKPALAGMTLTIPSGSTRVNSAKKVSVINNGAGLVIFAGPVNAGGSLAIGEAIDLYWDQDSSTWVGLKIATSDNIIDANGTTLALYHNEHAGRYVRCSNASGCDLTITETALAAWKDGDVIEIRRTESAGALTLTLGSGVTLDGNNVGSVPQGGNFKLKYLGSDEWDFITVT